MVSLVINACCFLIIYYGTKKPAVLEKTNVNSNEGLFFVNYVCQCHFVKYESYVREISKNFAIRPKHSLCSNKLKRKLPVV